MRRALLLIAFAAVAVGCDSAPETCPDGELETEDVVVGTGAEQAMTSSTVILSYVGRLPDGEEFDRGSNVRLSLQRTILGFSLGVTGMRTGGTRLITIPPNLGYGPNAQEDIPACSTLIFEVELRDIVS